jgi:hypothetical protein
LFWVGTRFW